MQSIVADIGGTNTRVAMADGDRVDRASIRRFANADYPGIDAVLTAYLAAAGISRCDGACVAAAGPVHDGVAVMTNLGWVIDRAKVGTATGANRVAILNDLQAQGHGLGHLAQGSLRSIVAPAGPPPPPDAVRLVIGVGTGFNAATVHETVTSRIVTASECGQMSLPVANEADLRLAQHVRSLNGFACVEDILSGRGLERLYGWLADTPPAAAPVRAATIMAALADGTDPAAIATRETFLRLLGTVIGDLALAHLPFGGIYLIGGVARAFTPYLPIGGFADAFRAKGRFSTFMQKFPIHVIEDDYAALAGCAVWLMNERGGTGVEPIGDS